MIFALQDTISGLMSGHKLPLNEQSLNRNFILSSYNLSMYQTHTHLGTNPNRRTLKLFAFISDCL